MAQKKQKGLKKLKIKSKIEGYKMKQDTYQRGILHAVNAARQKILRQKKAKLSQCRGLKNFKPKIEKSIERENDMKKKNIQIAPKTIDMKHFDYQNNHVKLSSSLGIILQYESQQSQSIEKTPSNLYIRQFKVSKVNKSDYLFELYPSRGKCYFKNCIQFSLLHQLDKYVATEDSLVTLTPKFNKDKNSKTRAFYNWATDMKDGNGFLDDPDSQMEKKSEQKQQIFVPKPVGTFCRVCNIKFADYLSHIKSKAHLKSIKTYSKKYEHEWMIQLPHFELINNIKNDKCQGFTRCAAPKLTKKQIKLAKLILKADSQSCKNYFKILKDIKQLTSQIKYSLVISQAIKKCTVCQASTQLSDALDSEWLVCNTCNQKVHISCLKDEKCEFCKTRPRPQIQKWEEVESILMKGIQSLGYINDNFEIPVNSDSINCEKQVERYLSGRGIKYRRWITFYNNKILDPLRVFFQPHIARVSFELENAYRLYHQGNIFPPVEVREISQQIGVGVFSINFIKKNTFLCEYGGDLIPAAYSHLNQKYNMDLLEGACTYSSLMITVLKTSSLGPLLNHSENPNCRTLRCYIGNCVRIIMYTIHNIQTGEQLTYNYNESQKNYPTNDFKSFK